MRKSPECHTREENYGCGTPDTPDTGCGSYTGNSVPMNQTWASIQGNGHANSSLTDGYWQEYWCSLDVPGHSDGNGVGKADRDAYKKLEEFLLTQAEESLIVPPWAEAEAEAYSLADKLANAATTEEYNAIVGLLELSRTSDA